MYSYLNKKYEALCACNNVNVTIHTVTDEDRENCLPLLSDKTDSYMDCCFSFDEKDEDKCPSVRNTLAIY